MHFDLQAIIPTIGYIGIAAIIFAETGLMVGFFLPGDSLLFTAGFLASQGIFNIWILAPLCFIAAVAGNTTGYLLGKHFGKKLFRREDSVLFHRDHLKRAQAFYEKHGKMTIMIAQFVAILRTFSPVVAGIGDMHYPTFIGYNIIGALLWAVGVTVAGFFLGKSIPNVDKYLLPAIVIIVLLSVLPTLGHILKDPKARHEIFALIRKPFAKKKAS